jgi:hypothetical protein
VLVTNASPGDADDELQDLERSGLVRRGSGVFPEEVLKPGPAVRGKGVMSALLNEGPDADAFLGFIGARSLDR